MQDKPRFEGLTLTVDNVDASIAFYSELLGLTLAHNAAPDFAMIKIAGDLGGTIGLLSIDEAPRKASPIRRLRRKGRSMSSSLPTTSTASMTSWSPKAWSSPSHPTTSPGNES